MKKVVFVYAIIWAIIYLVTCFLTQKLNGKNMTFEQLIFVALYSGIGVTLIAIATESRE